MENVLITIVFAIPEPFKSEVINLHDKLTEEYSTKFISEFQTYTPHITIYQAEFPKKNENVVLEKVQSIANSFNKILFVSNKLSIRGKYIAVAFKKNKEIETIHENIVSELNPLREGNVKSIYIDTPQNFSAEEIANVNVWGYPYVMELYSPHMTIVR